jgi:hypothetical protein
MATGSHALLSWNPFMCLQVAALNAAATSAAAAAAPGNLATPPQAAVLQAPPGVHSTISTTTSSSSTSQAGASVSMLGALGGCSQVLAADTPLGGGVLLGCHYQVLQKPWLPLDTAVRQFKVHLSLMATKARLHQQQQQHAGPVVDQEPQQQVHVQQQRRQQVQQPVLSQQQQQQPLEQPLLVREPSDSSSNPSNQQLLTLAAAEQPGVPMAMPAPLLHVACDDAYSDSSLGPGTPTGSSLGTPKAAGGVGQAPQQRQRVDLQTCSGSIG